MSTPAATASGTRCCRAASAPGAGGGLSAVHVEDHPAAAG
jgi:hypothetical protein